MEDDKNDVFADLAAEYSGHDYCLSLIDCNLEFHPCIHLCISEPDGETCLVSNVLEELQVCQPGS